MPRKFESKEEYLLYLRHLFSYEFARDKVSKNSFVLEMGCGEGYGTKLLSQKAARIIGLDVDKNIVARASKKYGSGKCTFRMYDGTRIPYGNNTFDTIVSFQVIEHIQDDMNYVSEIHRVLKRNETFILTTPNGTYRSKPGQKPWNRFHVREYRPHELGNVLRSRFSDVKVWGISGKEEVQKIEIERVRQSLNIIFLDPFNLRKLVPEPLRPTIIRTVRRILHGARVSRNDRDFVSKYSTGDYYVTQNDVQNSLDLLGICKK